MPDPRVQKGKENQDPGLSPNHRKIIAEPREPLSLFKLDRESVLDPTAHALNLSIGR